jgi:hypothetical protein
MLNLTERVKGITVVAVLTTLALVVGLAIGSVIAGLQFGSDADNEPKSKPARAAAIQPTQSQPPAATQPPIVSPSPKQQPSNHASTFERNEVSPNETKPDNSETKKDKKESANTVSIPVVVRIENGRVVEAYAAKPQPGHEAYEATAVRLARQRRFNIASGSETIVLTISGK